MRKREEEEEAAFLSAAAAQLPSPLPLLSFKGPVAPSVKHVRN
jgi:hypothetical protein